MTPAQLDTLRLLTTLPFTTLLFEGSPLYGAVTADTDDGLTVEVYTTAPVSVRVLDRVIPGVPMRFRSREDSSEGVASVILDGLSIARSMRPTR